MIAYEKYFFQNTESSIPAWEAFYINGYSHSIKVGDLVQPCKMSIKVELYTKK